MSLCLSTGLRCSLKPSFSRRLVSPLYWLNWTAYFVLEGTRTLNLRLRRASPYPLGPRTLVSISFHFPHDDNIATTNSIPGCTRRFLYRRKPLCHAAVGRRPVSGYFWMRKIFFLSRKKFYFSVMCVFTHCKPEASSYNVHNSSHFHNHALLCSRFEK